MRICESWRKRSSASGVNGRWKRLSARASAQQAKRGSEGSEEAEMARGGKCPQCGYYLFARNERYEVGGAWVWYECANRMCNYAIKKFESDGRR
jgi:hypothetical protein